MWYENLVLINIRKTIFQMINYRIIYSIEKLLDK